MGKENDDFVQEKKKLHLATVFEESFLGHILKVGSLNTKGR